MATEFININELNFRGARLAVVVR